MSETMYTLWCILEGDVSPFSVEAPSTTSIHALKERIYKEGSRMFAGLNAVDLTLWKVDVEFDVVTVEMERGEYRPDANDKLKLPPHNKISQVWHEPPPDSLHIFISLPSGVGSPNLNAGDQPAVIDTELTREYDDIFIKVKKWGPFEKSDIDENGISIFRRDTNHFNRLPVPDFVVKIERELDSKRGLDPNVSDGHSALPLASLVSLFIYNDSFVNTYFGGSTIEDVSAEGSTPERESEPQKLARRSEVIHLAYIASHDWERLWRDRSGGTLKKGLADGMFFHYLTADAVGPVTAVTGQHSWSFNLIVKGPADSNRMDREFRTYTPRSDFLVSISKLPRLLVEVNSTYKQEYPGDLCRMLLTGAVVVRFANRFLDRFKEKKDFVLFAMYIWDDGKVTRFSLFQDPNDEEALCCLETNDWLNSSEGRAKFVRQLYNLRDMLERDKEEVRDADANIKKLQNVIKKHKNEHPMKSFTTKDGTARGTKRKRDNNVGDPGAGGGAEGRGTDCAELRAHGYEVEPQDIEDETGSVIMKPLFNMPSHILIVYHQSDQSKKFIAKKVHGESNEIEIFKLLNTFQSKCEHIIALHESFQTRSTSWAILPTMSTIAACVSLAPDKLGEKVTQVCWGLIKGVAYLHKFFIAHRDIKPENLVVDRKFCLKIIDFDVAMKVKDEDELVDGQCGTKGWMAPEIEEKSKYSPIKADRWSSGQVLLYLLDRSGKANTDLRATARKLTAHIPEQRSSMLQVATSLPTDVCRGGRVWSGRDRGDWDPNQSLSSPLKEDEQVTTDSSEIRL